MSVSGRGSRASTPLTSRGCWSSDARFTKGALLVGGFLAGRWDVKRAGGRATLNVELFRRLAKAERSSVTDEGEQLLGFTASHLEARDVLLA